MQLDIHWHVLKPLINSIRDRWGNYISVSVFLKIATSKVDSGFCKIENFSLNIVMVQAVATDLGIVKSQTSQRVWWFTII